MKEKNTLQTGLLDDDSACSYYDSERRRKRRMHAQASIISDINIFTEFLKRFRDRPFPNPIMNNDTSIFASNSRRKEIRYSKQPIQNPRQPRCKDNNANEKPNKLPNHNP